MAESFLKIDLTNQNPDLEEFPHPFYTGDLGLGQVPKSKLVFKMMSLSASIRSKPNWHEKMRNETIRNKWKQEALEPGSLTEKQIDYVLDELEYYNSIRNDDISMSAVDGVWQSDELIPTDIKESLITCVKTLEDVPDTEKDWHPGTDNQVLDLLHPSLFCLTSSVSRIINDKKKVIGIEDSLSHHENTEVIIFDEAFPTHKVWSVYAVSNTYQWLPANFNISENGDVKFQSYINNLHPLQNLHLYKVLENILSKFVPLFNKTLTGLANEELKPSPDDANEKTNWYEEPQLEEVPDEDKDDQYEDYYRNRQPIIPDVKKFTMPDLGQLNAIDLKGRKLQVIVKLANIILTPENPNYKGGAWHVEGMLNEHIVATGIYYYINSNITESNLQFRTAVCEPNYEQNDDVGIKTVFDLENEHPLNQKLGEVVTQEDRCIVFPNIYQHRVAPFQLRDPSQPGLRKILVFFLIDPAHRIVSTANVPPQQFHWYSPGDKSETTMSMEQAKEHREKLMKERKFFINQNNEQLFERPFSLCEH